MASSHIRQYISRIESSGGLSTVSVLADPILEIAAVTNRLCKRPDGGAALLFEQPSGSRFQVVTNLFGSDKRVCQALGVGELKELTSLLGGLLGQIPGFDTNNLDGQIAALPEFSRFAPRAFSEPDRDLIRMVTPDLAIFPFLQSWPGDGAADGYPRYITLPQVFTSDPDGGTANCGMYRAQLRGKREIAIQWKTGSGAARHAEQYRRRGKKMPVAVVLGGDPALLFSAMSPLPGNLDELTFAGFLRGFPLATLPCQSVPLHVPTGTEVVIEGHVEPGETVTEGPFGNHTGFYSPAAPAALMRVTAISHRPDAIIPATIVGPPPMEDCWMAQAWERLLLAFLQQIAPEIKDIRFPFEWVFHQSAIVSIENPQPEMVRNISARLWALPWFASARLLLFVTACPETAGLSHAAWRTMNVTDFSTDMYHDKRSGRIAVDATGCRQFRPELVTSASCATLVEQRWKEYGLA